MRSGEYVDVTPVKMPNGDPIMLKDDENADDARGQVFEFYDAEERMTRAIEVWVALDPVTGGPDTVVHPNGTRGRVKFVSYDLYKRRNGSLFRFPIDEAGDGQTVSNLQQTGNRRPTDIYKGKKFVYATGADVVAILQKGEANKRAFEARRASEDPMRAQQALGELIASAIKENAEAVAQRITLAQLLKENREQEIAAGQPPTTSAALPTDVLAGSVPAASTEVLGGLSAPAPRPPRPPRT